MTLARLDSTLNAMLRRPFLTSASGAFLRNPAGGVEDVAEMKAAGMSWLALNIGDGQAWNDWRIVIDRARAIGVDVFPWARCRTLAECYDLLDQADLVGFRALLNLEDELETVCPPAKVAEILADFPELEVGISSVAWLYNDVDFTPFASLPVLLQIFPQDNRWEPAEIELRQQECVKHARAKGFTYVGVTVQAYGGAKPEWYGYIEGTFSIFTGDDVGAGNWAAWAA